MSARKRGPRKGTQRIVSTELARRRKPAGAGEQRTGARPRLIPLVPQDSLPPIHPRKHFLDAGIVQWAYSPTVPGVALFLCPAGVGLLMDLIFFVFFLSSC